MNNSAKRDKNIVPAAALAAAATAAKPAQKKSMKHNGGFVAGVFIFLFSLGMFTASAAADVLYTQNVPDYVEPHVEASLNEICPRVYEMENPPVVTVSTFDRRFGVKVYSISFVKGDVAFEFDLLADTINRTVTGLTVNREENCI